MKRILFLHGYGGKPAQDRIDHYESLGYEIDYPHINYDLEWQKDNLKSIFEILLSTIDKYDIVAGTSLGGYLSYELAKASGINAILINPALNRLNSNIGIGNLKNDNKTKQSNIEIYFGELDVDVPRNKQIPILKQNNTKYTEHIIARMEHRVAIWDLELISNISSLIYCNESPKSKE